MASRTVWICTAGACALLVLELMLISQTVDAYSLVLEGSNHGWIRLFGYMGQLAKWWVLGSVIALLLLKGRFNAYRQKLRESFHLRRFTLAIAANLIAVSLFYYFSQLIFANPEQASALGPLPFVAWVLAGGSTLLAWLFAFATPKNLALFIVREKWLLLCAYGLAGVVWFVANASSTLWGPLADATFSLAAFWLAIIGTDNIYVDAAEKIIGVNDFYVQVADACSGYEGIGLVLAFTGVYIWINKREFRFPHAYLLFPLGAAAIWLLNSIRIAALVLLGAHFSPDMAVGGFHSQAGWLTFIATSLGLLWLAGSTRFFARSPLSISIPLKTELGNGSDDSTASAQQAIACLVPLVALLLVSLVTNTFSAGFDWLYPLRVMAVIAALAWIWRDLEVPKIAQSLKPLSLGISVVVGFAVAILWVLILGDTPARDREIANGLAELPVNYSYFWIAARFLGSALTVPIAEELAFRGYLLCKLSRSTNYCYGSLPFVGFAIVLSSVAFGVLHGAWFAGTIAGLSYALLRWRSGSILAPILAHALTNAALFVYALTTEQWGLL
jgi:exosortase E/protease (VPEID-CTERM system)